MSKIVFFCIPAHGHTNPTLSVVKELISLGHQVWYYSYEAFRGKIEATGATFVSCDAYDCEQKLSPEDGKRISTDIAFATHVLVETTLALDEVVCQQMKELQPDCIVSDSMAVWGKGIAKKLNIPYVCSTTTFAFNKESAKIMEQQGLAGLKQLFQLLLVLPKINKDLKRLQVKGYPFRNVLSIIQNDNDTDTVVYTSRDFQPCAESFSEKYAFVGPSIRDSGAPWPKGERSLLYISMGTVVNEQLGFYRNCIKALRDSPYDVVLSVGSQVTIDDLGLLPEHIKAYPTVDQISVLRSADAFLTHCGMNSVSEGLYFEVPLILYPQTTEQKGVAKRVQDCGAGLLLESCDPVSIRNAVDSIFADKTHQQAAARIADSFRHSGGAKAAAETILRCCRT